MKRLWITAALTLTLSLAGCRCFDPEPAPVVYYQPQQSYSQPCVPMCAPVTSQCLPAQTVTSSPTPMPANNRPMLPARQ